MLISYSFVEGNIPLNNPIDNVTYRRHFTKKACNDSLQHCPKVSSMYRNVFISFLEVPTAPEQMLASL
jgi:hypothetical protein